MAGTYIELIKSNVCGQVHGVLCTLPYIISSVDFLWIPQSLSFFLLENSEHHKPDQSVYMCGTLDFIIRNQINLETEANFGGTKRFYWMLSTWLESSVRTVCSVYERTHNSHSHSISLPSNHHCEHTDAGTPREIVFYANNRFDGSFASHFAFVRNAPFVAIGTWSAVVHGSGRVIRFHILPCSGSFHYSLRMTSPISTIYPSRFYDWSFFGPKRCTHISYE